MPTTGRSRQIDMVVVVDEPCTLCDRVGIVVERMVATLLSTTTHHRGAR